MAVYDRYTRFRSEVRAEGGIRFGGPFTVAQNVTGSQGQGLLSLVPGLGPRKLIYVEDGTISVVVPAQAAATSADVSLAIANAKVGDTIVLNPADAAVESGMTICSVRCAVAGTVKVNIGNLKAAAALTGSTTNWNYMLLRGAA